MKFIRKISGLLLATILATSISAQNNDCYFKKSFNSQSGTYVSLKNKYGDITIVTTKDDSVSICATITIDQNDKELVQRNLKLIHINIARQRDTISVLTTFDRKFFLDTYRQGRKSFRVDYLVKVPLYIGISITNEFGNISLEELSGSLYARLSNGILNIRKLSRDNKKPINEIYVDHGKVIISECNWLNLIVENCPSVYLGKARAIIIYSEFSKIQLGEISSLVSSSKSDNYSIESIKNIVSESLYSIYDIGEISGHVKSTATFGSIRISDLHKDFNGIDIVANKSLIDINLRDGISFKSDILVVSTLVDFPIEDYPDIIKSENDKTTTFVGIAGENMQTRSLVKIRQKFGKLTIH